MNLCLVVNIIKIRIKGYLKDIDEGKITNIDCLGIKNKDKITYVEDNVTNTIRIEDEVIYLIRENNEFKNPVENDCFLISLEYLRKAEIKNNTFHKPFKVNKRVVGELIEEKNHISD